MIDLINRALSGRYRVDSLAGRGGMATVYRAVDLRHDRDVAIKVMHPEFAQSVGRERFLREIHVTAGLSHPHLLALYDSGQIDDLLFYVTPFVEGDSLRQRLQLESRLPLADVRKIVREAAEALSYAHARGIVHRDIKPENILLSGYTPGTAARRWNTLVADFGVSALTTVAPDHLTATGIAVGSPQYMSPEQAVGEGVDGRTDIWALGCVAYEMLEGAPPRGVVGFTRRDLPATVAPAVLRALAHDPAKRFTDAVELADAIDGDVQSSISPRRHLKAWMAGAVTLVLFAAAASLSHSSSRGKRATTRDSLALVLYNRGEVSVAARTEGGLTEALADFSRAIERDSGFALAWAGVARTAQMSLLRGFTIPGRSPDSLLNLAVAASQRAILLDSGLAEVWLVRARVLESVDPTTRAAVVNNIRRALAIDSTYGDAWFALGRAREEMLDTAGARVGYANGVRFAPKHLELLGFYALHYLWTSQPREGMKWADSAIALDPTYLFARDAAVLLATELHDWTAAERHVEAELRLSHGADVVHTLGHAARLAALRGDGATARRIAQRAELLTERLRESSALTKHEAAYLGEAFSAAGDTARALQWLAAFSPRRDAHYQLHLHRDPALAWLHDPRYAFLLVPSELDSLAHR